MEVFIRNTPDQASEKQLDKFFRPFLAKCSIQSYHFRKLKGRGCATITVADEVKGRAFLNLHGKGPGLSKAKDQLFYMGREIHCSASHRPPEKFLVQSLRKEDADKLQKSKMKKPTPNQTGQPERKFEFASLSCGLWSYDDKSSVVFEEYFRDARKGTVMFGTKMMTLLLNPPMCRVDIPYSSVESVTTGVRWDPTITLSLMEAPRMFEPVANTDDLISIFNSLSIQTRPRVFKRKRVTSISNAHASIVNSCYVYRFSLTEPMYFSHVCNLLNRDREMMPPTKSWPTITAPPSAPFSEGISQMNSALAKGYLFLPFGLRFQVQKLVQNAYLPPTKAIPLLPELAQMFHRSGETITVNAVRKLFNQIPFAGPNTEASQLELQALRGLLRDNEKACKIENSYKQNIAEKHDHIALVHIAKVTPAGIYLGGPEAETKNRVLRTYRNFTDYFLRVSFLDEDWEPIRFDRHASLTEVFHVRFKKVLGGAITIAGRPFEFLGFSHSSLRAQTCWFMAPFTHEGELHHARSVIAKLGDFSKIRSPAKCAARIGQAFSETFSTIHVPNVQEIPDVKRHNRVFSDGVGTISPSVLQRIWNEYALSRELKPTLFQIRYAGT
jgi:RNA dependent RNA polymerase